MLAENMTSSTESLRIRKLLEDALPQLGCKGALLGLSVNGVITTYAAGSIPAKDHQRPFYIYSISKTFTAVAIMKLCEDQGSFLDEPVAPLFPNRQLPVDITVRHLLNHTSGLSDYFSCPDYQLAVKEAPHAPWSYEKLMEVGLSRSPLFEPGAGWAYSNPGYALLRELIEQKSGMAFYDYVSEAIIDRIGLSDTRPFVEPDDALTLLEGEDPSIEGDFRSQYHPGWIATGCWISTVSDIARFYDALFGGKLVSPASVSEMTQTVKVLHDPPKASIPSYGLGLMHGRNSPLGDAYGHGGGGPGYTTYALHYPELNGKAVSICIVLNKSLPQTPFSLADDIAGYLKEWDVSAQTQPSRTSAKTSDDDQKATTKHRGLLHHQIITVSDVSRSAPFYGAMFRFFGYTLAGSQYGDGYEYEDWKRFDLETPHEISVVKADTEFHSVSHQRGAVGHHHHIAFCAASRSDVDQFHREVLIPLAAAGLCNIEDAPCDCPEYGEGYYATYFTDPDGLKYEFVINPNHRMKD